MAYTTIKKPSDYFNTKLWTGNGSTQSITGVGFQPDFTWVKGRSEPEHHTINDSVRGANKQLYSHLTYGESTDTDRLQSFDSDGFTLGTDVVVNKSSQTFASWNWLAANGTASNTDGSITSTVSANTTSGFSIVSYTGTGSNATVGHGLGVTPKMVIIKNRSDGTQFWGVYHASLSGADQYLVLDQNVSAQSGSAIFNSTHPTSSVFSVGTHGTTNESGDNFIAYCFADVKGFSKFGSYTGNGNADGTFVYTGFSPSFVMLKRTNTTGSWTMYDNKRHTYNPNGEYLLANSSGASVDFDNVDFLSNGFKLRDASFNNGSGDTIIYMCFAEEPLVGDNPATAR